MMVLYKKITHFFLLTIIVISLFGCAKVTQENFEQVKPGMTMDQVTAILGEPTSTESINLMGISGTSATWKDDDSEITIQFFNGVVQIKTYTKSPTEKQNK